MKPKSISPRAFPTAKRNSSKVPMNDLMTSRSLLGQRALQTGQRLSQTGVSHRGQEGKNSLVPPSFLGTRGEEEEEESVGQVVEAMAVHLARSEEMSDIAGGNDGVHDGGDSDGAYGTFVGREGRAKEGGSDLEEDSKDTWSKV